MINEKFARKDKVFRFCCKLAKVDPTRRQASKYQNRKGRAFGIIKQHGHKTIAKMAEEKKKK